MRILIADDEPLARLRLKSIIEEINPTYEVYADARNGLEALEKSVEIQPDIAFLDIRMPKIDGLQVAAEIAKAKLKTHIVFVTAYDEYALEAFNKNAIDYLLKPVKKERLKQSIEKIELLNTPPSNIEQATGSLAQPRQHLCAHTHTGLKVFNVKEILFFKADNKYVLAATANDSILLEEPLKTLEDEFPARFFRIHRNALVNVHAIKSITKSASGQFNVHLHDCDETLIISRRHRADLNRFLRQKA